MYTMIDCMFVYAPNPPFLPLTYTVISYVCTCPRLKRTLPPATGTDLGDLNNTNEPKVEIKTEPGHTSTSPKATTHKTTTSTTTATATTTTTDPNNTTSSSTSSGKDSSESAASLKPGKIGKIQLMKSGRVYLMTEAGQKFEV